MIVRHARVRARPRKQHNVFTRTNEYKTYEVPRPNSPEFRFSWFPDDLRDLRNYNITVITSCWCEDYNKLAVISSRTSLDLGNFVNLNVCLFSRARRPRCENDDDEDVFICVRISSFDQIRRRYRVVFASAAVGRIGPVAELCFLRPTENFFRVPCNFFFSWTIFSPVVNM